MSDGDRALLARLSLEEKVSLLSGKDHWSLPALPSIGLESIVMSDGPTGVKGGRKGPATRPTIPCGTALAATWDADLVEDVASILGETARAAGVHVLLAPATNMLRSPLAGRNFEYFSEDPLLAGTMTAAYVRGVQGQSVAATVKHFVCNDAESDRMTGSVEVDEQTLRELYLLPFEMAVRDAHTWALMCSYNKLRGTYMSAHALLNELLRDEWGFAGVVVSDWGAVHDTVASSMSGLDIEMPGPGVFRGEKLLAAVRSGEVPERTIDEKVLRILELARRTGALGAVPDRRARRSPSEVAAILRRAAAESFVLLKNDGELLPLDPGSKLAVLGRVAALPPLQGGGSANVGVLFSPTPLDGIRAVAEDVRYEPGYVSSTIPRLDLAWVEALDGTAGFTVEYHEVSDPTGPPIAVETRYSDRFVFREIVAGRHLADVVVRVRAILTPPLAGEYVFGVSCAGSCALRIGGVPVLELGAEHDLDWSYLYRPETRGRAAVELEAGTRVAFELDYRMAPGPHGPIGLIALRAQAPGPEPEDLARRAVDAATEADVAVVFAGLGEEHECEGYDRTTLELPSEQQQLIAAVAAANPRTVVVLSAGAPVSVDWADRVLAVLLVWYAGQELGAALGDVLFGGIEPGGRLPMTLPARADGSALLDPGPDDPGTCTWHYDEGLFVGYRRFDRYEIEPAYCFGHGLGFTRFDYQELLVGRNGETVEVSVRIRNRGRRRGKEVVQLYVGSEDERRPRLELKAFERIDLDAAAEGTVTFVLGERAFSRWNDETGGFEPIPGRHELAVGASSRDLRLREGVTFR